MTFTTPIINLNGSDAADLKAQQRAIYDAARTLAEALMLGTPHGRDYQCNEPGDYDCARLDHYKSLEAVQEVRARAVAITRAIELREIGA